MKGIKKILSMVLAIVCIIGLFPTAKVEASIVTVMVAIRQGLMRRWKLCNICYSTLGKWYFLCKC